jgi:hypothetical protein
VRNLLLFILAAAGTFAMAQTIDFPDFNLETQYEMDYIAHNRAVKNYVARLGGTAFTVNSGKPDLLSYAVTVNNGCTFDVEVVYADWPGIDNLILSQAHCR